MRGLIALGLCCAVAACSTPTPPIYFRGTALPEKLAQDRQACEAEGWLAEGDACYQVDVFERCMKSRGYAAIPGTAKKDGCPPNPAGRERVPVDLP